LGCSLILAVDWGQLATEPRLRPHFFLLKRENEARPIGTETGEEWAFTALKKNTTAEDWSSFTGGEQFPRITLITANTDSNFHIFHFLLLFSGNSQDQDFRFRFLWRIRHNPERLWISFSGRRKPSLKSRGYMNLVPFCGLRFWSKRLLIRELLTLKASTNVLFCSKNLKAKLFRLDRHFLKAFSSAFFLYSVPIVGQEYPLLCAFVIRFWGRSTFFAFEVGVPLHIFSSMFWARRVNPLGTKNASLSLCLFILRAF